MALDERFILGAPLDQYFVDKDSGEPLANGEIYFYRDDARAELKTVYQITGTPGNYSYTALPNPVTLNGSGQIVNGSNQNVALYYFPFEGTPDNSTGEIDLYYVAAFSSGGLAQWTREGWPNITAGNDPTNDEFPVQNQIANPQFTNIFINKGFSTVFNFAAATDSIVNLAPDWDLVVSGTGTVTIERIAVAGNQNVPTSPPYILDIIVSANITKCQLRQRMNVNSGLWASTDGVDIYLSGTILARNENTGTAGIQMFYEESAGGSPVTILNQSFENDYVELKGATTTPVPASSNSDSGEDGYIDIYISLAGNSHIRLSSVQVVPTTASGTGNLLPYDRKTSNREQALQGDFFIPALNQREAEPLLVGWDFTKNPFQFAASTGNIGNAADYLCDQTIAFRGATGNVAYARSSITNGLQLTTAGANDAFYFMQYLSGAEVKRILGTKLSCNVWAWQDNASTPATMRVYLFRGGSTASIPGLTTSIGTVATNGVFSLTAANWTEIPRGGLDTAKATLGQISANTDINNTSFDYGFSQWQLTDASQIGDTDKFAIVVTFAYTEASTVITLNDINVTTNAIPSRTPVKTFEQTLEECRRYYQKSFLIGTVPAQSAGLAGAEFDAQNALSANERAFNVRFYPEMRNTPTLTLYNPSNTNALVRNIDAASDWVSTTAANLSARGFRITGQSTGAAGQAIAIHWQANARLGG